MLSINDFRKKFKFHINKDSAPFDRLTHTRNGKDAYNLDFEVWLPTKKMNLQRPLVWTEFQKQEFIISILKERPIPKISVIRHEIDDKKENVVYQIIDGKQRVSTYISYVKNGFPLLIENKEYFFKDLPKDLQYEIEHHFYFRGDLAYSYYDAPISDEDKITWFDQINFAGTPQDTEHIRKLKEPVFIPKIQYNVCNTCGAKDGRAGMCFGVKQQDGTYNGHECENCYDTRRTGVITIHQRLNRTDEELQKTMAILDNTKNEI